MNGLRLVAIGRMSPLRDEIICDDAFLDTWHSGLADSMDAPRTKLRWLGDEECADEADDYENDILDRADWARGEW